MLNYSAYLILGIGTCVGKTYLTTNLCKKNPNIKAIKPVISGFKNDSKSDTALLLKAMGLKDNLANLDSISPWRFSKPLSPNFAGKVIYSKLLEFCHKKINDCKKSKNKLLIEGAGGILSPINEQKTFLDLAHDLNLPIILVTTNFLGSISYTLSAIEVIKSRNINLLSIILNDYISEPPISNKKFINCVKNFTNHNVIEIKNYLNNSLIER